MELNINRRQFIAGGTVVAAGAALAGLAGCSSDGGSSSAASSAATSEVAAPEKLIFAWEPSNSGESYEAMRDAMAEAIAEGAGVPCEPMTTTDYNVTIEALSSGQAHIASLGASEYVEIHERNPKIEVAFVLSDKEGKLNPVSYYSQILCREGEESKYQNADGTFNPESLRGEKYSFVSLSSTSGYVIPATIFKKQFGEDSIDVFAEGGQFFDEVVMSTSQPLSVYQVASGNVNLCSCDNTSASAAYNVVSGENGEVGTVYEVKEGLEGELADWAGARLVCIESYPVPAVPFCINTEYVPEDMVKAITDYMTSDEVANNPEVFVDPKNPSHDSKYKKSSDEICFVAADDSYYDDYRELVGE